MCDEGLNDAFSIASHYLSFFEGKASSVSIMDDDVENAKSKGVFD